MKPQAGCFECDPSRDLPWLLRKAGLSTTWQQPLLSIEFFSKMAEMDIFETMGIAGFGKTTKKKQLDPARFDKNKRKEVSVIVRTWIHYTPTQHQNYSFQPNLLPLIHIAKSSGTLQARPAVL
jgi:hypothetical protein